MKNKLLTLLTLTLAFCVSSLNSMAQISTPRPSPAGSVMSTVGLTDVTIDYFRPKVKGRKIFGEGDAFLQPYGQTWRTGANSGSKLTLSTDATIGGQTVKAGKYLIFTVPGKDEWSFMLYSDVSIGGNIAGYDKSKEVLNVKVKPTMLSTPVETMTFNIADISDDNTMAAIELTWADVSIKVPMTVNFDDEVMAQIKKYTQVDPDNYADAADYYFNNGKDLEQALKWMNMYLAVGDNNKQFWNVHTKAKILAKMGKIKEAKAAAEESMAKAKASPQGDFGYIKMNEELIKSLK